MACKVYVQVLRACKYLYLCYRPNRRKTYSISGSKFSFVRGGRSSTKDARMEAGAESIKRDTGREYLNPSTCGGEVWAFVLGQGQYQLLSFIVRFERMKRKRR